MIAITRSALKALLTALITAAVLIFIMAFIAYRTNDPERLLGYFGTGVFLVSCFVGGAVMARERNYVSGSMIFALIYILICLALSLILGNKANVTKLILTYGTGFGAAVFAGILFCGSKSKKPKGLKRYKNNRRQGKR